MSPDSHHATWRGHVQHPGSASDSVEALIDWGPATPFFPPRISFVGCASVVHQLNDGSLCLLPPVDPKQGWEGVLDISYWLQRAEEWLQRFFDEDWGIHPLVWHFNRSMMPGYRYRHVLPERRVVALPPSWSEMAPGFGRVAVAVPEGPGLAAVVKWDQAGRGEAQHWDAGLRLVKSPKLLWGVWARFPPDPEAPFQFSAPSLQRRYERLLHECWRCSAQEGSERVLLSSTTLDLGHGPVEHWSYKHLMAPGYLPGTSDPLSQLLAASGLSKDAGTGIVLNHEALDVRRRAGRSDEMHEAITGTQVVIAGLGSLGSEIAHLLAQEGIQNFYLVDGDSLMPGNEARHRAGLPHAGRPKVEVVAELIRDVQPQADVQVYQGWVDELAPQLSSSDTAPTIIVGATGDEASEHFLGDMARSLDTPCVHGWLEVDGTVLRAFRCLPGLDPTISAVAGDSETPRLTVRADPEGPRVCADTVLPGSSLSIHAAANFLVRLILDVVTGEWSDENHWLFAPSGLKDADAPPELRRPYGVLGVELNPEARRL